MSTLIIRKKSLKTWLHIDSVLGDFIISKFYFNADGLNFQIVEQGQSKRVIYNVTDITLYDDTVSGSAETFGSITALSLRLEELNYPAFQYDGQITSIAGLIVEGSGIDITGSGTEADPYVIIGLAGSTPTLQEVLTEGGVVTDTGLAITFENGTDSEVKIKSDLIQLKDKTIAGLTNRLSTKGFYITEDEDEIPVPNWVQVEVENPISQGGSILFPAVSAEVVNYVDLNEFRTGSFSALNGIRYTANGTLTVTDPTPVANKGYIVHVIGGTATIDGVGYTIGALVYRYYDGSDWVTTDMNAGGSAVWGGITGTLSDQTDLQTALDAKLAIIAGANYRLVASDGSGNRGNVSAITASRALKSDSNGIPTHFDTATEPSLTELAHVKGVTSAIQTQLNARIKNIVVDTANSSAVTGTTSETLCKTYQITGGTFSASDFFKFMVSAEKTGGNAVFRISVKLNTTNNSATATQVATFVTTNAGFIDLAIERVRLAFKGGNLRGLGFSTSVMTDITNSANAKGQMALDPANDIWMYVFVTPSSALDSIVISDVQVTN